MATEWKNYVKGGILFLVKEYGLAYTKPDLSIVTSAYVEDVRLSGCYAQGNPSYKDHQESFWAIYEATLSLFDELHQEAPGLFIDCTFETTGKMHLMDYAFAQHADGNWLSNFEDKHPIGPLIVRQMAWWRCLAVPASSLVIGNQLLQNDDLDFTLKSLKGTFPIMLGDPRKLSTEQRKWYKQWSVWMSKVQMRHQYMDFRKDLRGFGEPQEGHWDRWQRINSDTKSGGVVGIFRQGSAEEVRKVVLDDLDPTIKYEVLEALGGTSIGIYTGEQLLSKGFEVRLESPFSSKIYEINIVKPY